MINIYEVSTGNLLRVLSTKLSLIYSLKFSNSGKILCAGDEMGFLYIYSIDGHEKSKFSEMIFKKSPIYGIEFKSDDS